MDQLLKIPSAKEITFHDLESSNLYMNQLLKNSKERFYIRLCKKYKLNIDQYLAEREDNTVWSFAYHKYGWDSIIYDSYAIFPKTHRYAYRIPDISYGDACTITHHNLESYKKYWRSIDKEMLNYGIVVISRDKKKNTARISYRHIPSIEVNAKYYPPYMACDTEMLNKLQEKLVRQYGTPYQEEVILLQELTKLPMPIALAIADCILATIERRFISSSKPHFRYDSSWARKHEEICDLKN